MPRASHLCRAQGGSPPDPTDDRYLQMRAEVQAPFRSLRIVIFGFSCASVATGTLIALTQLVGALAGSAAAVGTVESCAQTLAIDVAGLVLFATLLRRDLKARDAQMVRLAREERLGALRVELPSGTMRRMSELRGFARPVVVAGTPEHVRAALEAAGPFRAKMAERGITVVALPCFGDTQDPRELLASIPEPEEAPEAPPAPAQGKGGERPWAVAASRTGEWKSWVVDQLAQAGKTEAEAGERGIFIGLRMDGRVRSSGLGNPPWARYCAELAPPKGLFGGLGDGFDGSVRID
ncbi:unnamed protein product [Pedinophyceae sp. YPF-701]|nr:unnamed protein product [Pedinophyceae sp. YPF-701]